MNRISYITDKKLSDNNSTLYDLLNKNPFSFIQRIISKILHLVIFSLKNIGKFFKFLNLNLFFTRKNYSSKLIFKGNSYGCKNYQDCCHYYHRRLTDFKPAFTLAESLITLVIIGVIAAISLPMVITNVQERVRQEQVRMAKYKFTKATDLMNLKDLIGPYESTEAFVNELKNHLKIAKICDVNHLTDCFGYEKAKLFDGTEYELKNTKTGEDLGMGYKVKEDKDYTSNNVGIVTLDGTSMILSFNKKCQAPDNKVLQWSMEGGKPVTNASASCVAAVMDINGNQKPNILNKDLVLFNAKTLGSPCAFKTTKGTCFTAFYVPTPYTKAECEKYNKEENLGIKECGSEQDYWANAVHHCGGVSNMPSSEHLAEIASDIYGTTIAAEADYPSGLSYNKSVAGSYGLPVTYDTERYPNAEAEEWYFILFSSEEYTGKSAGARGFNKTGSRYHSKEENDSATVNYTHREGANRSAVCLGDE